MIGLMMVMLMVFFRCGELVLVYVLWGVGSIPRVEYGIKGQNYVALIRGNEKSAGLHSRNLLFYIKSYRIIRSVKLWQPSGLHVSFLPHRNEIVSVQGTAHLLC